MVIYFKTDELSVKSKDSKKDFSLTNNGPGCVYLHRAHKSLHGVQCLMDQNGATDLVIDLIIAEPNTNVFLEAIQLAISLLEGGNGVVQVS